MAENKNIIYLVGFMGTGKSTVGKALAAKLNYEFVDLDDYIEEFAGKAIKDIFKDIGEEGFRDLETACLEKISTTENYVVACGGGVPLRECNRSILTNSGQAAWLDAEAKEIVKRVSENDNRPLVKGKSPAEIEKMKLGREPIYQSLGAVKIDTTGKSVEEISKNIIDVLHL